MKKYFFIAIACSIITLVEFIIMSLASALHWIFSVNFLAERRLFYYSFGYRQCFMLIDFGY